MKKNKSTTETKCNILLRQITTAILANKALINNSGLHDGLSGSIMFLYNYAKDHENELIYNSANQLLLRVLDIVNNSNLTFSNGLSGIGWMIRYLQKNDFIELDDIDAFFSNIEDLIIRENIAPLDSTGTTFFLVSEIEPENKEMRTYLKMEKIYDYLDQMENNLFYENFISVDIFKKHVSNPINLKSFLYKTEQIFNYLFILKAAFQKKIYPEIVEKMLDYYFHKSVLILEFLKNVNIHESDIFNEGTKLEIEITFHRMYLFYITSGKLLGIRNIMRSSFYKGEFISNSSKKRQRYLDCNNHIRLILLLNLLIKINQESPDEDLEYRMHNILEIICRETMLNDQLVTPFLLRDENFNIGLSGLAGIGMTLLSTKNKKDNWSESKFLA